MKYLQTLFIMLITTLIVVTTLGVGHQARADNHVTFANSSKGCTVKGLIRSTFEPTKATGTALFGNVIPMHAVVDSPAIEDLKRQAAVLGANRIIIRDAVSEGTTMFRPQTGTVPDWHNTTIIAEAVRC
jgi:hypothetical protein